MKLTLYQVDAFTSNMFGGNPAAVIPLEKWLDDQLMQTIAQENNLSETVFFVPSEDPDADFDIRWFTPAIEINLCGHATLASAYVIFRFLETGKQNITFNSKSGLLKVDKRADVIVMDFPAWMPTKTDTPTEPFAKALGIPIVAMYRHRDLLIEVKDEDAVKNCKPDFTAIKALGEKVIITAQGSADVDFISRFFAPTAGIDEDPVTGSAHSQLIPFWGERLNKKKMFARQLSSRGGDIWCGLWGDRVTMAGQCVFYMKGEIYL